MAFSTVQFIFVFLPLALAVYSVAPRGLRNTVLALFSLLFYAWAGPRYALMLVAFAGANWLFGLHLGRTDHKKSALTLFVALDLALLFVFKYLGFALETLNLFRSVAAPGWQPLAPLGLSFYIFIAVGYLADIAAGRAGPEKNPVRFFVFLAFFGHASSGPIVRYPQQAPQLDAAARRVTLEGLCCAIRRFVLGLAKKTLIADQLGLITMRVHSVPAATLPAPVLLLGTVAYMMQLYFDFSGYTDMAIGVGGMFGITLPENFDLPYLSRSVGEFWRRWHMSLSTWFRDYVYFPLGGSRCSIRRTCFNLVVVFLLTGLWHGAAWQFALFGLLHGAMMCVERLGLRRRLEKLPAICGRVYTLVFLWATMTLFGANGVREALLTLRGILCWQPGDAAYTLAPFADTKLLAVLAVAVLFSGPIQRVCPALGRWARSEKAPGPAGMVLLLVLLVLGIMRVTAGTYSAFIYFQF